MPMLRITVDDDTARLHDASSPVTSRLQEALSANTGPVIVMVHGYKYLPGHPHHCPHGTLLSRAPQGRSWKVVSWPERLGLNGTPGAGIGISFGWPARGSIWSAYGRAEAAGHALAALIGDIKAMAPDRDVTVIGHSLGARVALSAIRAGAPGAISRAVLLAAAEYCDTAHAALTGPAGQQTDVLNVTSRENDLYDFILERLIAPARAGDKMLGHGNVDLPNMVTLQLDDMHSLSALRSLGFAIAAPERRVCHWSPYLRNGVFDLYAALLRGTLPMAHLRRKLPRETAPRWSRLRLRLPRPQGPLVPAE